MPVQEAMGDAAYGDGVTRQAFADAGRRLVARVPGRPDRQRFPKDDFCHRPGGGQLHLSGGAGHPQHRAGGTAYGCRGSGPPPAGLPVRRVRMYDLSTAVPVHLGQRQEGTVGADPSPGSPVAGGPALQQSAGYDEYRARPSGGGTQVGPAGHLGIRQSRYFGRVKTRFQLYLAATVANLTLVAAKAGLPAGTDGDTSVGSALRAGTIRAALDFVPPRIAQILTLALLASASLPEYIFRNKAFRPDF